MAQKLIAQNKFVDQVTYALPNKHYVPIDMKYIGIDNVTPLSIHFVFACVVPLPRCTPRSSAAASAIAADWATVEGGAGEERTLGAGYLRACADLQSSERIGVASTHVRGRVDTLRVDANCSAGGWWASRARSHGDPKR